MDIQGWLQVLTVLIGLGFHYMGFIAKVARVETRLDHFDAFEAKVEREMTDVKIELKGDIYAVKKDLNKRIDGFEARCINHNG